MNPERKYPSGRVTPEYRASVEASAAMPAEIPQPERFRLSSNDGWLQWETRMRETGVFRSTDIEGMMLEAIDLQAPHEKRIYVDRYPQHLKDEHKIGKPGVDVEEYSDTKNTWENTTVIWRPWQHIKAVRLANETEHDLVADSRNIFILPKETQQKVKKSIVASAGAGVAGATTYLWSLSGGKEFRISDPAPLGQHKLNRFIGADIADIGVNQAVLLARLIYEASPYANVLCDTKGLGEDGDPNAYSMTEFFNGATFGIEGMDNLTMKTKARALLKILDIPCVMPTDLNREGFVGFNDEVLTRLTPEAAQQLATAFDFKARTNLAIDVFIGDKAPDDMLTPLHHARDKGLGYWPQSGISAFTSAAGAVYTMIEYLEGATDIPTERPIRLGWTNKDGK